MRARPAAVATGAPPPRRLHRARGVAAAAAIACVAAVAVLAAARSFLVAVDGALATRGQAPRHLAPRAPRFALSAPPAVARAAAGAAEAAPGAEAAGKLMLPERYIAMNRFQVRDGSGADFEEKWARRPSSLLQQRGFRWFGLLKRVPPTGETEAYEYPDDYNYVSLSLWETKHDFSVWHQSPAFKEAHGEGDILSFVTGVVSGFLTNKGPPKPAFFHGFLPEFAAKAKPRLVSRPASGDFVEPTLLRPQVFVAMNRFVVSPGRERDFEDIWASRESKLRDTDGFRFFQMLRRDQTPDDDVNYISMSVWEDRASFNRWRSSDAFKSAHGGAGNRTAGGGQPGPPAAGPPAGARAGPMGGALQRPPKPYFYEGKFILESEKGA